MNQSLIIQHCFVLFKCVCVCVVFMQDTQDGMGWELEVGSGTTFLDSSLVQQDRTGQALCSV